MVTLILCLRDEAGISYEDLCRDYVRQKAEALDASSRSDERIKKAVQDASKSISNFINKASIGDEDLVWTSVGRACATHIDRLSPLARRLYADLYGLSSTTPSAILDDMSAGWAGAIADALLIPRNIERDVVRLAEILSVHRGLYEVIWRSRKPARPGKPYSRAVLEISPPAQQQNYPVFRLLYTSSKRQEQNEPYEVHGVVLPTANGLYLIGSEMELENLFVLVIEKHVKPREIIAGLITRKHTELSLFSANAIVRRLKSRQLADEAARAGQFSASELEGFDTYKELLGAGDSRNGGGIIHV